MVTSHSRSAKQPTRQVIVEAAKRHIYQNGYGSTSYANVAEETKLGKGNIQYHFKSKNDLLEAVVDAQIQGIREQLESWSLDCGTAYDCIERFIGMVEGNANDLSRYGCPMGSLNTELGKHERDLQQHVRRMFDLFLRWLEARFRSFLPSDQARLHAEQLMVMAQGASLLAHAYQDPKIIHRQADVMRQWLAGICPDS